MAPEFHPLQQGASENPIFQHVAKRLIADFPMVVVQEQA